MQFVVEQININHVIKNDKERFNSNNHWNDNIAPDDYSERISKTNTNVWIDKFRTNYKKIIIDDMTEIHWMIKASEISCQTGKFTNLYEEELHNFLSKYEPMYKHIFDGTGYFVRGERVSMKYGQHKEGPYYNLGQIIESVVSCIRSHKELREDSKNLTIYLLDWININEFDEYRVFVYNNKITAVSQQNVYNVYAELNNSSLVMSRLKSIVDYFESNINGTIPMESYTYDFTFVDGKFPYFIEANSFGKEYAAGSSLFHWIIDKDILYGKHKDIIYFRYTGRCTHLSEDIMILR